MPRNKKSVFSLDELKDLKKQLEKVRDKVESATLKFKAGGPYNIDIAAHERNVKRYNKKLLEKIDNKFTKRVEEYSKFKFTKSKKSTKELIGILTDNKLSIKHENIFNGRDEHLRCEVNNYPEYDETSRDKTITKLNATIEHIQYRIDKDKDVKSSLIGSINQFADDVSFLHSNKEQAAVLRDERNMPEAVSSIMFEFARGNGNMEENVVEVKNYQQMG